jgi:hypothetical protein
VSELSHGARGTIGICSPRARESEIFAQQFYDAFIKAGWDARKVVVDLNEAEIDSGVLLLTYYGNTPPSQPDFSGIERAFLVADVPYKPTHLALMRAYTNGVTTSDPVILVGKRFEY